jgi:hypothetical protein
MLPAKYDLALYRGDTLRLGLRLWNDADGTDPTDLDGVIASSQVRVRPDAEPAIELTCAVTLPNIIDVRLDSDLSRTLPKKGVWDLRVLFPGGDVVTPIAGKVTVKPDVTVEAAP